MATDSGAKGSPAGNALLRWAELIETGTNGELDVKVFYQSELGGPQNVFDLYIANDINITLNWPMTSAFSRRPKPLASAPSEHFCSPCCAAE